MRIFSKQSLRVFYITLYIIFIVTAVLYACITYPVNDIKPAETKDYRVPYTPTPANCGVLFRFPDNSACLLNMDFKNQKMNGLFFEKLNNDESADFAGYKNDYTVELNYTAIAGIIDRVGGIELTLNNETLRYTGVQICEILSVTKEKKDLNIAIFLQVLQKISENGFSKDDISYIIEYSNTTLSIPICYDWDLYIKQMCKNANIIV